MTMIMIPSVLLISNRGCDAHSPQPDSMEKILPPQLRPTSSKMMITTQ